jgi:putative transposase
MKKSRFKTEQIIGIVKEHESGLKASDLARRHGVSEHTIYRWRSKYGGLSVSEAARLKQLEDENRKLKHVVAEQVLDIRALKVALGKDY